MQRQMFLQISDFLTRYTFHIPYLHAAAIKRSSRITHRDVASGGLLRGAVLGEIKVRSDCSAIYFILVVPGYAIDQLCGAEIFNGIFLCLCINPWN
jgi:hypothetical protein